MAEHIWSYWDDTVETALRVNHYPYGGGVAQSGVQLTLGQRSDGQIMAVRLPQESVRELALALLAGTPRPPCPIDPLCTVDHLNAKGSPPWLTTGTTSTRAASTSPWSRCCCCRTPSSGTRSTSAGNGGQRGEVLRVRTA